MDTGMTSPACLFDPSLALSPDDVISIMDEMSILEVRHPCTLLTTVSMVARRNSLPDSIYFVGVSQHRNFVGSSQPARLGRAQGFQHRLCQMCRPSLQRAMQVTYL